MRTCVWDIETTNLEAVGAGWILCAVVKPLGEKEKVFRYDTTHCKHAHEEAMLKSIVDELMQYDLLVHHNGDRFDWPFVKSRLIQLGLPLPGVYPFSYDTKKGFQRAGFRTVDNGYGYPSASLDMVVDFFNLEQLKTKIYPRKHWEVVWDEGTPIGKQRMDELVEHCRHDVKMTEAIYPLILKADLRATVSRLR